jgi:GH25 family lysozyme M1 (1,4-beta-N-acetylmuramidase)
MLWLLLACTDVTGSLRQAPAGLVDDATVDTDAEIPDDTDTPPDTDLPIDDVQIDVAYTGDWDEVYGIDVSGWNPTIDWDAVVAGGIGFAYVKATEGTTFQSSEYYNQYDGAKDAGLIRGAYHFARPENSSGYDQANWFADAGGNWTDDGWTLPGALDIEHNPYGDTCYGLSPSEMEDWVIDFVDQYETRTGRAPAVYSTAYWWDTCVGSDGFGDLTLWVAHYGTSSPNIPDGWPGYDIWQYAASETVSGVTGAVDGNHFAGDYDALMDLAANR